MKMPRDIVTLACDECKQRNYVTTRNRRTQQDRYERKKYCRFCRKHTLHKENR
ncbi:50S ribosomal protein L33 [Candidatus Poribacteria bacterium]|nr:MAG: 50S ribosomal protein L33 [Candidatus Poribacteria bacterium]